MIFEAELVNAVVPDSLLLPRSVASEVVMAHKEWRGARVKMENTVTRVHRARQCTVSAGRAVCVCVCVCVCVYLYYFCEREIDSFYERVCDDVLALRLAEVMRGIFVFREEQVNVMA